MRQTFLDASSVKPFFPSSIFFFLLSCGQVKISDVALVKMVMHAVSGGRLEVMGILQGKIEGDTMVVMDSFALPVEGTETRVNAAAECAGYMIQVGGDFGTWVFAFFHISSTTPPKVPRVLRTD